MAESSCSLQEIVSKVNSFDTYKKVIDLYAARNQSCDSPVLKDFTRAVALSLHDLSRKVWNYYYRHYDDDEY